MESSQQHSVVNMACESGSSTRGRRGCARPILRRLLRLSFQSRSAFAANATRGADAGDLRAQEDSDEVPVLVAGVEQKAHDMAMDLLLLGDSSVVTFLSSVSSL